MNQRTFGILLHSSSLSGPFSVGDLGPPPTAFADFMVARGQRWGPMLSIVPTGEANFSYQSPSAFAGDPLLVSPDLLVEQGLPDRQDIEPPVYGDEGKVNYFTAARLK